MNKCEVNHAAECESFITRIYETFYDYLCGRLSEKDYITALDKLSEEE